MADKTHRYAVTVRWTGNTGAGTQNYRGYERAHDIVAEGKPVIAGSSDPAFRGDAGRWNPEELLVASLSACHKLWFLGLCAQAGIVVTAYEDDAEGCMIEEADGGGQFTSVTLRPRVTVSAGSDVEQARALHEKAHGLCFIARSVNFPVRNAPVIVREPPVDR
ncbi:OsmC family protein [Gluconacetobacter asukensis]|uniref:OsmC family protein n=1 Tax=Gluconacetobacter asukensis TaxID=1017181 RepID=A0A7W4J0B4_9PROT|nr:OsmC family protein [Gluconacetobacter asukensis]MBB2172294.1 OsmC family protein [Gluconacetobacter asukensis]